MDAQNWGTGNSRKTVELGCAAVYMSPIDFPLEGNLVIVLVRHARARERKRI